MNIIFFGTPRYAVPSLETLTQHPDIQVQAVVTQPDKRRGRGNQLNPSPVKTVAVQHDIPVIQPRRIKKAPKAIATLANYQADAFVVVAYGQILSQEILDLPRLGAINAHGSLLPAYRGAAPIQWSLVDGCAETGVTTMLMDAGMDTGAMLLTRSQPIALTDHALDLAKSLSAMSAALLVDTLLQLERGELRPEPQDDALATYARLIDKADYSLDWSKPAIALHNQIRGFYPNCIAPFREATLKITATLPVGVPDLELPPEFASLTATWASAIAANPVAPGQIGAIMKGVGPIVQTGTGGLLLRQVQPAGKRSQSGSDFANGFRVTLGEQFT